jgi:hypothetical protein
LTTKDQKTNSRENHENQPHPTTTNPPKESQSSPSAARSRFIFLEIASYKRCSRPLCSSQTTTPNHTPHTSTCMPGAARKPETNKPEKPPAAKSHGQPPVLLPQDPTVCQTLPSANRAGRFPGHPLPPGKRNIRTNNRPVPPGTYLLIFHP